MTKQCPCCGAAGPLTHSLEYGLLCSDCIEEALYIDIDEYDECL